MTGSQPSPIVPPLRPIVGVIIAALLLSAVFLLTMPDELLWQRVLEDSGHGPVFAGFAFVLLWMWAPPAESAVRSPQQYWQVFAIAVALGVGTELAQWFMPERNVSARDALHDAAGAILGLAAFWGLERWRARRQGAHIEFTRGALVASLALASFALLAWPILECARAYAERARAWPALLPLGEPAASVFVNSERARRSWERLPDPYARASDGPSLRLSFGQGERPYLQLPEPVPDWSGHDVLVFDVTNASAQDISVVLRILDRTHDWTAADRFNQGLVIPAATRTTIRISLEAVAAAPRSRRMDMTAIADVMLFAAQPLDAGDLYVTRIALE